MRVTDVKVRRISTESRMKAVVSITFDDMFAVHDIKVIQGEKGLFVAMPSKRMTNGEYKDIAHPISVETRKMVESVVLDAYQEALSKMEEEQQEQVVGL